MIWRLNLQPVRHWLAAACLALAPMAWAHPCDNVLEVSRNTPDADQAATMLGACLAAPGPADMQLLAAHELLKLSRGEALACRYTEIVERMLEFSLPELDDATLGRIAGSARTQACACDLEWVRAHGLKPGDARPSWFGEDAPQRLLVHGARAGSATPQELLVSYRRGMDHVCLFAGEAVGYAESRGAVTSGFERGEFFGDAGQKPMAVLVWRAGVHGEALQVVDLAAGASVLEIRSDWPVNYWLQAGTLHYEVYRERDDGSGLEVVRSAFAHDVGRHPD